jgi:gliding motility-associated-like protein
MRHSIFLLLVIINWQAHAQNLLNNGSFEFGGSGDGFKVDGQGYIYLPPPFSKNTIPGHYTFVTNPKDVADYFVSTPDHTSGKGRMMVIDGTNVGGDQRFWKAGDNGGGVCNLTIGRVHTFSYWIKSLTNEPYAQIGVDIKPAKILSINSSNSMVPVPVRAPEKGEDWKKVIYYIEPTNSCVNIEMFISNTTSDGIGNDFAIDDLELKAVPFETTYSVTQSNCLSPNGGLIAIYPKGGVAPYSYTLSGGSLTKDTVNNTGVFTNLPGGTYSYTVKDDSNAESKEQNIQLNSISPLVISPQDTIICKENSLEITATGGSGNYEWFSNPSENGFPKSGASVTVAPKIKTTYTVKDSPLNLVYNGDFSKGNVGFETNYLFYEPFNRVGAYKAYGITSNSKFWFDKFSSCTSESSATGNMMVVDGSTSNQGTDSFWCQQIAVQPNKNYVFSYRITSVAPESPAIIQTWVNGKNIGSKNLTNATCSWSMVVQNWNSGKDTIAQICLVDANFEGTGNDFAIDDITLETTTCSKDLVVTLKNIPSPPKISGDNLVCLNSNPEAIQVQNPQGTINWYADENLNSLILTGNSILPSTKQNGIYYATETINDCESEPSAFQLTVNPCEVVIPSAFTPNNDLENDFWELVNLDLNYPKNKVKIFNRWGNLLFESPPGKYSEKPWDGKYQDKQLPVGSYFYVIDLSDDGSIEPLNGSVSIILKR